MEVIADEAAEETFQSLTKLHSFNIMLQLRFFTGDVDTESPRKRKKHLNSLKGRDSFAVAFLSDLLVLFMRNANLSNASTVALIDVSDQLSQIFLELLTPLADMMMINTFHHEVIR